MCNQQDINAVLEATAQLTHIVLITHKELTDYIDSMKCPALVIL